MPATRYPGTAARQPVPPSATTVSSIRVNAPAIAGDITAAGDITVLADVARDINVDLLTEMADMMTARRAYDANVEVMSNTKAMINRALEIGK